jgi:hypothetical protein
MVGRPAGRVDALSPNTIIQKYESFFVRRDHRRAGGSSAGPASATRMQFGLGRVDTMPDSFSIALVVNEPASVCGRRARFSARGVAESQL